MFELVFSWSIFTLVQFYLTFALHFVNTYISYLKALDVGAC